MSLKKFTRYEEIQSRRKTDNVPNLSDDIQRNYYLKEISDSLALIYDKIDKQFDEIVEINNGILANTDPYS